MINIHFNKIILFLFLFLNSFLWGQEKKATKSEDILILRNGKQIWGNFLTSNLSSVSFETKKEGRKTFPFSQIKGVVLGAKNISFGQGIRPGFPQEERGQVFKSNLFFYTIYPSIAIASWGAFDWLRWQAFIQSKGERITNNDLEKANTNQTIAATLFITGLASFIFFYSWHIMDWKSWGDNYDAFLSTYYKDAYYSTSSLSTLPQPQKESLIYSNHYLKDNQTNGIVYKIKRNFYF